MRRARASRSWRCLLLLALFLASVACRRSESLPPVPVDCREDTTCFLERARVCHPASVRVATQYTVEGHPTQVKALYEVVGWARGQCHLRRTQVDPPLPPDAGPDTEAYPPYPDDRRSYERIQMTYAQPAVLPPPVLQCLYPEEQVSRALQGFWSNTSTPESLAPCYPGDGSCQDIPVPLLGPGCVLAPCLAGRWTFTCEDLFDPRHPISVCVGTRLSDENPHCFLYCKEDGRIEVGCGKPKVPKLPKRNHPATLPR